MEFFRIKRDIPFMRYALIFNVISIVTFLIAVGALATRGLNLGVDFTGGTLMEVTYQDSADLNRIRDHMARLGFTEAAVQNFGSSHDVLIRLPVKEGVTSAKLSETVLQELTRDEPNVKMQRVEFVGPQVGEELFQNGALALLFVSLGIVLYLWFRFEWKFGVAAIVANLHDVVIILGCFSIFQWEFGLPVLAAVLAILGYSVNESVVVFDRVRENFRNRRFRTAPVHTVIDNAITRTMSRTIITHGSTQIMVTSMLVFGGETLHYFALALTIGILFGIYSSVLVASPIVMWLGVSREDLVKPEKKAGPEAVV
jgi:preprotein translocase subunit SecF